MVVLPRGPAPRPSESSVANLDLANAAITR
jgi:hypothetical protein